jgi:uncharacterized membrane protein
MGFSSLVEDVGRGVEALGISIMVIGIVIAVALLLAPRGHAEAALEVSETRQRIGGAILLGLEVLVAGDIIRTVAVKPTFTSVGVLAAIVAIRTFLSMTIELEVTGRLPWQKRNGKTEGV